MGNAVRDANNTATLLGISSVDGITPVPIRVDPITGAIMCKIISGNQFSPLTTKGDIYTYSNTQDRLPVGTNGQILVADSAQSTGLRWATMGGGSGDVVGPDSSVDGEIPLFSGTTGKLLKRGTSAGTLTLNGATGTILTNPIVQLTNSVNGFTQLSIQNKSTGTSASSDMIVYPDNNTNDTTGFTDMGVSGSTFADASYAITTPNDSYIFGSCVSGSGKLGNLVIATDSTGTLNNIIFGIGGFKSLNKERMRITNTGISIGYQSIATGTIALYNSGNAFNTSIIPGTIAGNSVITLPNATSTISTTNLVETISGVKTFLDTTFGLRNVANTFTSFFTNTNTASRTYTLKDASGTLAFTSDITGTNSGTNTGDETLATIGTKAFTASGKTTPVDADSFNIFDSAASNVLKLLTFTNLKAFLKTYFDTLYASLAGSITQTFSVLQLEVGNASDTTIARSSAGVISVEGVVLPSISSTNTITNKTFTTGNIYTANINAQTGTTYTFVLTDQSKLCTFTNASAIAVTIPTNASVAFPIGTQIDCSQDGAGKVTFSGAGVTINSLSSLKSIGGQYVGATLIKTATDTWNLYGNLIA